MATLLRCFALSVSATYVYLGVYCVRALACYITYILYCISDGCLGLQNILPYLLSVILVSRILSCDSECVWSHMVDPVDVNFCYILPCLLCVVCLYAVLDPVDVNGLLYIQYFRVYCVWFACILQYTESCECECLPHTFGFTVCGYWHASLYSVFVNDIRIHTFVFTLYFCWYAGLYPMDVNG